MRAMLVQQGLVDALKEPTTLPSSPLSESEKAAMIEKTHSYIILCLGDKALRKVGSEKTTWEVWLKLGDNDTRVHILIRC